MGKLGRADAVKARALKRSVESCIMGVVVMVEVGSESVLVVLLKGFDELIASVVYNYRVCRAESTAG